MSRNKVARTIDATYRVGDVWIVQKGHEADAELLKQAMDEIDRLEARNSHLLEQIDSDLLEARKELSSAIDAQTALRDKWAKLIDDLQPEIKRIRNAAKALVSNIDKTSFHGEEPA